MNMDQTPVPLIPRKIHYCWFGYGRKPSLSEYCISSWQRYLPEYEIMEWNEDNFNIQSCPYVEESYRAGKFAFVSDVARGQALYDHGGIYLDTDVEILRSLDSLLHHRSFWGFEAGNFVATSTIGMVKGHEFMKEYLGLFAGRHFVQPDGFFDYTTNVSMVTELWRQRGLVLDNTLQEMDDGNCIYPQNFFSPYDYRLGATVRFPESYAVHHYAGTWNSSSLLKIKKHIKKISLMILGRKLGSALWLKKNDV